MLPIFRLAAAATLALAIYMGLVASDRQMSGLAELAYIGAIFGIAFIIQEVIVIVRRRGDDS